MSGRWDSDEEPAAPSGLPPAAPAVPAVSPGTGPHRSPASRCAGPAAVRRPQPGRGQPGRETSPVDAHTDRGAALALTTSPPPLAVAALVSSTAGGNPRCLRRRLLDTRPSEWSSPPTPRTRPKRPSPAGNSVVAHRDRQERHGPLSGPGAPGTTRYRCCEAERIWRCRRRPQRRLRRINLRRSTGALTASAVHSARRPAAPAPSLMLSRRSSTAGGWASVTHHRIAP